MPASMIEFNKQTFLSQHILGSKKRLNKLLNYKVGYKYIKNSVIIAVVVGARGAD